MSERAITDEQQAALDARHENASRRLQMAVRLELNRFVASAIEDRLRARPHFFARMQVPPRQSLRGRVDSEAIRAAEGLAQPIADLRVYYGAEIRTIEEEDRGFATTVAEVAHEVANQMLAEMAFPDDPTPDHAASTGVDLDATYALAFAPAPALMWAWRQVRELDMVRNQLADGAPPTFETRWHLPELG